MARVTIGLPVHNGERTLETALESLVGQTYHDLRLVVSDNASTDATPRLCEAYAARDPRITYVRQPRNIGAAGNFRFVLDQAESEYFMWAAADDTRTPDFVAANVAFLEANPGFVGSTCRARFVGGEYDPVLMGDESLDQATPGERMLRFVSAWHANSRFYGLFRVAALRHAMEGVDPYLGADWVVTLRLLTVGKLERLEVGSLDRGRGGASGSSDYLSSMHTRKLHWLLPFGELLRDVRPLLRPEPIGVQVRVLRRLLHMNWQAVDMKARMRARLALARVLQR